MKVTVCRKEHFNAAHRLHNPQWDAATNLKVFGKCNNPNFHGHNYDLVVKVRGDIDPETGYVMNLGHLKDLIREQVLDYLDHKNLNLDIAEFRDLNPTAENIVVVIWNRLQRHLNPELELSVTLCETERNFVEYHGG